MAHDIPANLLARLRTIVPLPVQGEAPQQQQRQHAQQDQPQHIGKHNEDGLYDPSPIDVAVVRIMLARSKRLPPDLVDSIFEMAEYWVRSTTAVDFGQMPGQARYMSVRGGVQPENEFMLRSLPVGLTSEHGGDLDLTGAAARPLALGKEMDERSFARLADYPTPWLVSPVRKVVFKILAHDQGWGGEGGDNDYDNSWTWFEAGLERFEAPQSGEGGEPVTLQYEALRPVHPALNVRPPTDEERRKAESADFDQFVNRVNQSLNTNSGGNAGPGAGPQASTPAAQPQDNSNNARPPTMYKHNLLPNPEWVVHRNKRSNREWQQHIVTWSCDDDVKADSDGGQALADEGRGRETGDGEFVRQLKVGDVVTLWAKARFAGWANSVQSASIDIYWAV